MQLSATRYIKLEGTLVTATVNTAAEAKIAVKELRHKKREFTHLKRALLRQKKAAEQRLARIKGRRGKPSPPPTLLTRLRSAASLFSRAAPVPADASDLPRLERDLAQTEDTLHNIDEAILQLEGKLIHLS